MNNNQSQKEFYPHNWESSSNRSHGKEVWIHTCNVCGTSVRTFDSNPPPARNCQKKESEEQGQLSAIRGHLREIYKEVMIPKLSEIERIIQEIKIKVIPEKKCAHSSNYELKKTRREEVKKTRWVLFCADCKEMVFGRNTKFESLEESQMENLIRSFREVFNVTIEEGSE